MTDLPRLSPEIDRAAVSLIRGLAMDAPLAAKSGHQGTAMALAPLGHVLFSRVLKADPADPEWFDRDRFVLSAGHASILQYALLFLQGSGVEMDDLRSFRQWGSRTPGHPERGHTPGVEVTTGPLGQGLANAVGLALAERHLRARLGAELVDHHTWVIAGDGCLMEGVSHEAASLAGHQRLGRLVVIFDDNHITIDGRTDLTCSDDVAARFASYGWSVTRLGEIADDLDALESALVTARDAADDRPKLLILRTRVGSPSPDWTDRHEAHGNPFTADHVARTKATMGIPDEPFWAPNDVVDACRSQARSGSARRSAWQSRYERSERKALFDRLLDSRDAVANAQLPSFDAGEQVATRVAVQKVFDSLLEVCPELVAGAADLTGNTGAKLTGQDGMSAETPEGRQLYYGVREHAMGSIMVGLASHGGVLPVGGTFFVFFDYMKPPVRLAALSGVRCIFVFSHDSVGVGEDGPTHQPIEHLAALRAIPDLQVIRPADANETAAAVRAAVLHDGPTALVLSRQNLPVVSDGTAVDRGAGIVRDGHDVVVVATGSEVAVALEAAELLANEGISCRVVSMPSWDRFEAFRHRDRAGAELVLPPSVPTVSIEAGSTLGWAKYADVTLGIDRFGASAPGGVALRELGMTSDAVVAAARELIGG
ncbi:MAG: transketolase [Actinomycetota bacterium]|nr:transketolase [Actinomycetota bacterium]MDA2970899.1 transketolase [Actinomycetota bacterium]